MSRMLSAFRVISHDEFAGRPFRHGFTTRGPEAGDEDGGDEDFASVARAAGFAELRTLTQVHGNRVVRAEEANSGEVADAVVTNQPGLLLGIRSADCVPILFCDPDREVVGAAHAGWRGTAGGVGPATVRALREAYGCAPGRLRALLGPAIGPCCYEVGTEVLDALEGAAPGAGSVAGRGANGGPTVNLWRANRMLLEAAGLDPAHILLVNLCTRCRADLFPSYRRDGEGCGRMLSFIGVGSHLG